MSYTRVLHLFVKVMLHGRYTIISRRIGVVISIIVLGCYNMMAPGSGLQLNGWAMLSYSTTLLLLCGI